MPRAACEFSKREGKGGLQTGRMRGICRVRLEYSGRAGEASAVTALGDVLFTLICPWAVMLMMMMVMMMAQWDQRCVWSIDFKASLNHFSMYGASMEGRGFDSLQRAKCGHLARLVAVCHSDVGVVDLQKAPQNTVRAAVICPIIPWHVWQLHVGWELVHPFSSVLPEENRLLSQKNVPQADLDLDQLVFCGSSLDETHSTLCNMNTSISLNFLWIKLHIFPWVILQISDKFGLDGNHLFLSGPQLHHKRFQSLQEDRKKHQSLPRAHWLHRAWWNGCRDTVAIARGYPSGLYSKYCVAHTVKTVGPWAMNLFMCALSQVLSCVLALLVL